MIVVATQLDGSGNVKFYDHASLKVVHQKKISNGMQLLIACIAAYFKNIFNK